MARITVRHGVAAGYGLLFGRPLTVLGLTWLPAAVYAVGASSLVRHLSEAMGTPGISGVPARYVFVYFAGLVIATAAFGALIAVPLARQAFGLREEPVVAHLVVGPREIRLFFALLRYYAIVACALIVLAVVAGTVIGQAAHAQVDRGAPIVLMDVTLETWLNSIAGTAAVLLLLGFAVRYGFFLDAVAAAEDHARLRRARGLARGNFAAVTMVTLIVGAPAMVLLIASEMTLGGFDTSGFASSSAVVFTIVLTVGLVVLHTLFAGASAGAYSEMADASMPDEHYEPAYAQSAQAYAAAEPAPQEPEVEPLFVRLAREASEKAHQPALAVPPEHLPGAMDIATPEAEGAADAARFNWMPPPPDAHFGSDPHDAQHHEAETIVAPEAEAVIAAARNVVPADAISEAQTKLAVAAPLAGDVAAIEQAARAVHDDATTQIVGFDGHPMDVPEHAQHAEFPVPPLDPAGVIAAQSLQNPG